MEATKNLIKNLEKGIEKKKSKIERKNIRLSKADHFVIRKYIYYIRKTLMDLAQRSFVCDDFLWKDNNFNIKNQKNKRKDVIFIDEKSLFNEFLKTAKEENLAEISPDLFKIAFGKMINKDSYEDDIFFTSQFHIQKIKINDSAIFKVIF